MQTLKDVYGSDALTYDQLQERIKDNKEIKLANLASGEYVSKYRLEDAERLLKEEREKHSDYDPEWKEKLAEAQSLADTKIGEFKLNSAIAAALSNAKVRDEVAVKAHLSLDNVKLDDNGQLSGLSEQLDKLKADSPFLFEPEHKLTSFGVSTPGGSPSEHTGLKGAIEQYYNSK